MRSRRPKESRILSAAGDVIGSRYPGNRFARPRPTVRSRVRSRDQTKHRVRLIEIEVEKLRELLDPFCRTGTGHRAGTDHARRIDDVSCEINHPEIGDTAFMSKTDKNIL